MDQKLVLEAYQRTVNEIDDLLEYRYAAYNKEGLRHHILNIIEKLNKDLVKLK